jgi:hypothetical protein
LSALEVRRLAISAQLTVLLDTGLLAFGTPLSLLEIRVPARRAGWPVGVPVGPVVVPVGVSHARKTVRERGDLSMPVSLPNTLLDSCGVATAGIPFGSLSSSSVGRTMSVFPMIMSRSFLNSMPCRGFVK